MTNANLKILVVEDEYITQKTICNYLTEIGYQVIGTAMNADDAVAILNSKEVDFALLDITIQGEKNGIWLAEHIKENFSIPHLFLTAYADTETITNALKTEPLGYLVKPFQKHDLFTAIEIAILNFSKTNTSKDQHIIVKHQEVYKKINLADVLFFESNKNYLLIYCKNENYRYRTTINEFIKQLPNQFTQTHKGFIVNTEKIDSFSNSLINIDDFKIPISKTFKDAVLKSITK